MTEEIQKQKDPQEAFVYNMQALAQVVDTIREIPEQQKLKDDEESKDVSALQKVEFPENGGILTYMEGQAEPFRGFPWFEFVDKIDTFKKIGKAVLSGIYHNIVKKGKWKLVTLLPAVWLAKASVRVSIYVVYRQVDRFRLKPDKYSQPIRELYRAFTKERPKEKAKTRELRLMLRDFICMFLEFDNAYRFRVQDWMDEFNKYSFTDKPFDELSRIMDIAMARELTQESRDTWTLAKMILRYLRFDKEIRGIVFDALEEIDINEMLLSKEDINYCRPRKDYVFGFMQKTI